MSSRAVRVTHSRLSDPSDVFTRMVSTLSVPVFPGWTLSSIEFLTAKTTTTLANFLFLLSMPEEAIVRFLQTGVLCSRISCQPEE